MALTTRTLPSLMNGISRQPAILRSPDQTEDELNTWGQISSGLTRRPPTRTLAKLTGLNLNDALVHHINRDVFERYLVVISDTNIRVFDEETGDEKTVNAPSGLSYLAGGSSKTLRAITVADYTFIVNTTKTVRLLAVGDDELEPDPALVLPGGTNPSDIHNLPLDASRVPSFAPYQYSPNYASSAVVATVKSMDDLPTDSITGTYKVLGASETSFVSYYVRGDGSVWNETVAPGLRNGINSATMPHALRREADGTFTFAAFSWKPRRVGDQTSNPPPPFVDATIRDVFFYQNRLGFLVDESVVFSAAGDYGDFWRRTVLDYIDSDTLAAAATTTDVAILDYAVPFADGVMLFSAQRQLTLTNGESGLSAHSLAIQPVTRYVMAPNVRPSPIGSQVHFATDANGYVTIQEYTRLSGSNPTEAADITAHVPALVPPGASQIISAPDLDTLFVLVADGAEEDRSKVFAYQFFWDGDKKVISAWHPWDFGDGKPISGAYLDDGLTLLMDRPDGYYLERLDTSPSAISANQLHQIYLDRQVSVKGTYSGGSTTFTLPYTPDHDKVVIVRGTGTGRPESILNADGYTFNGTTISVLGDESDGHVTIGHLFETRVAFTRQFPTDWQGRPLTTGRLQLHTWTVNLTDTAYTRGVAYPYGDKVAELDPAAKHETLFTGKTLGDVTTILGERIYGNTAFTFSVAGDASKARVELVNDSAFASTWTSAEWEGLFFSRAL